MKYRSEIDGLRAVAVVPVILFHAGFERFSGGFVGVDVFFVISGYLITTIILDDLEYGNFSLLNFYERRARRILPAMIFIILCCLPAAWWLLPPSDMKDFAQSLMAVATFSANILFWLESGYFDTVAELKPLLHTWSLAVEEQFYIVFPLALMFAWRFGKRAIQRAFFVVFVLSLGLAHWGAYNEPEATFFLLPTRAWELLIGSFAAFHLRRGRIDTPHWLSDSLSSLGLAAILYAVFAFDDSTPFPSLYALIPTVGTVLIIVFALNGTFVHRLLSFRAFVGIGLISYSLYLWHQPLFAFYRHWRFPVTTEAEMIFLIVLSFALACLSYFLVEQPFRRTKLGRVRVFAVSLASLLVVAVTGGGTFALDGVPSRMGDREQLFREMMFYRAAYWDDFEPFENEESKMISAFPEKAVNVLVIGSSWAFDIAHALASYTDVNVAYQGMTSFRCNEYVLPNLPETNAKYSRVRESCERNQSRFSDIPENTSAILLADNLFEDGQYDDAETLRAFRNNLARIRETFVGPVIVVKGRPQWMFRGGLGISTRMSQIEPTANLHLQDLMVEPLSKLREIQDYYVDFYSRHDIIFASLIDSLCPRIDGDEVCQLTGDGDVLYFDEDHLTTLGGAWVAPHLEAVIDEAVH